MSNSFELNKSEWYTPQNVSENDYLNEKLETDKYGQWYSVQFQGDAETYLWMAKTAPVTGEKYWGHLEKTSSGKAVKFKKDKIPEGTDTPPEANSSSAKHSSSTDENIARAVALKAAVDLGVNDSTEALNVAEIFLSWLQGGKIVSEEPLPEYPGDEEEEL